MSLIRFPLEDIMGTGPVRETEFRAKLHALEMTPYANQAVLVPWIHNIELPIWVYLMVVAKLTPVAAVLSFGEACSPTVLWQGKRVTEAAESS
jgi:hypothetical protein